MFPSFCEVAEMIVIAFNLLAVLLVLLLVLLGHVAKRAPHAVCLYDPLCNDEVGSTPRAITP